MAKNFILVILFVVIYLTNDAFTLECYTTNLTALRAGNMQTGKYQLENCEEYMKGILRMRGISNAKLPPNVGFHCFTLTVEKGADDVIVKGCVPPYGCGLMKKIFTSKMRTVNHSRMHKVQCNECIGTGCNKPFFFEKSSSASSALLDY